VELVEAEDRTTAVLVAAVWEGAAEGRGLPELALAETLLVEEVVVVVWATLLLLVVDGLL
jgi:hypothetical protein